MIDTQYRVLAQIAKEVEHPEETSSDKLRTHIPMTGWPTDQVYLELKNQLEARGGVLVIVLDEIDKLVKKSGDDTLYNLTRINSDLKTSKVCIIGISNDLSFKDFLDPRVLSSLSEEEIVFPPYNAPQLCDILQQRADGAFIEGALDDGVIPLCAALAAQEHGDARRALDLLRISGELAERESCGRGRRAACQDGPGQDRDRLDDRVHLDPADAVQGRALLDDPARTARPDDLHVGRGLPGLPGGRDRARPRRADEPADHGPDLRARTCSGSSTRAWSRGAVRPDQGDVVRCELWQDPGGHHEGPAADRTGTEPDGQELGQEDTAVVNMDETDTTLVRLLEENSRIPTVELAAMLNRPAAEVEERIRALQVAGVIRRFTAIVDRARTDNEGVAAILELKVSPERDHGYDRIAERIARFDEVRSIRLITGTYDLHVLVTGKDMQEVARFVSEHIAPMERIRETATHIIMKSYKENGTLLFSRESGGERQPFSF